MGSLRDLHKTDKVVKKRPVQPNKRKFIYTATYPTMVRVGNESYQYRTGQILDDSVVGYFLAHFPDHVKEIS
jgi:hypothetical protein